MPLISVIVPVYNLSEYLKRSLESLFAQTHQELQFLVVDDGSTDDSGVLLDDIVLYESRLNSVHQANGGVTAARNTGIALATGDYIGFCDGDDEAEPILYEHLLGNLLKYDADISHCGVRILGLDGQERFFHNTGELLIQNHEDGLIGLFKGIRVEPSLWNKLYKASLFYGIRCDTSIIYNEDILLNTCLFKKALRSVFEDVCLYNYIRRDGSACKETVSDKHVFHPLEVRRRILEMVKDECDAIIRLCRENYLHHCISAYSLVKSKKGRRYRNYAKVFREDLINHRQWFELLPEGSRLQAWVIVHVPCLYSGLRFVYDALARKKKYG